jgi:hypothetical protein
VRDEDQLQAAVDTAWEEAKAGGSEISRASVEGVFRKYLVLEEVGLPAMQLDGERMDEKVNVWEVLTPHMGAGAKTWREIEDALTDDDRKRLQAICGDRTVAEVLEIGL